MNRIGKALWSLVALSITVILAWPFLKGNALSTPPSYARQWTVTASGTSASITLTLTAGSQPAAGPTQSVLVCHDGAAGSPDIYINFTDATAAAPTGGGKNLTIKQGEKINYDGRFHHLAYLSAGVDVALRVQATF